MVSTPPLRGPLTVISWVSKYFVETARSGTLLHRYTRPEKRMESLQRVKLDGFQMVISELEVDHDYLRRVMRYLEE
jgi:hypothetical protein